MEMQSVPQARYTLCGLSPLWHKVHVRRLSFLIGPKSSKNAPEKLGQVTNEKRLFVIVGPYDLSTVSRRQLRTATRSTWPCGWRKFEARWRIPVRKRLAHPVGHCEHSTAGGCDRAACCAYVGRRRFSQFVDVWKWIWHLQSLHSRIVNSSSFLYRIHGGPNKIIHCRTHKS